MAQGLQGLLVCKDQEGLWLRSGGGTDRNGLRGFPPVMGVAQQLDCFLMLIIVYGNSEHQFMFMSFYVYSWMDMVMENPNIKWMLG